MAERRTGHVDYVELPVKDADELARTRDFLSEVFGWTYTMWGDGYADTTDSGVTSGIFADERESPLPVVYADDLERLYERVIAAGGEITLETLSFPGGRRFHFREPSGNELAAWTGEPNE